MTPEDRARDIANKLEWFGKQKVSEADIQEIANHLREYGEELEEDRNRWADSAVRLEKALEQADAEGYRRGMEESAKIADVSAEYYSKGMKREDGALNPTIGSAAQTSWDIARAIRLQRGEEGGK